MILLNKTKSPEYVQGAIFNRLKIINSDKALTGKQLKIIYDELKLLFRFSKEITKQFNIKELKRGLKNV